MAFTYKGKKVNFLEMKKGSKTTRVYDLNNYNNLIKAGYSDASTTTKSTTTPTTTTPAKTEEKLSYTDLEDRDGTIYNKKTGKGYPTPSALAADLGITPSEIKWDKIQGDKIEYSDLENQNGTIVNTKTGKRYSTPTELAADLDISPQQIDWTKVSDTPTTPAPDPNPFDPTDDGGGAGGDGGDTGGDPDVDMTGWTTDMVDVFTNLTDMLEAQIAQGNTVSPDIEIDEATVAGFLTQASNELDPYYTSMIESAKTDLANTMRYRQESFALGATQAERRYGEQLEDIGVGAAEKGLAFSGIRQRAEGDLAQGTREAREQARRDLIYQTTGSGIATERMLGSSALQDFGFPTIAGQPNIIAGQAGFNRTGTTPLYQLSGGITGELERERTTAESLRQSEIEQAYRANRAEDYSNL